MFPKNFVFAYILPTVLCVLMCYWTDDSPEYIYPRKVNTVGNAGVQIFPETEIYFVDSTVQLIYSTTIKILNTDYSDAITKKALEKSKKKNKSDFDMDECKTGVLTPSAVPRPALIKVLTELDAAVLLQGYKLSIPVSKFHLYYNRSMIYNCTVDEHSRVLKFTISIPTVHDTYTFKKLAITQFPNPKDEYSNRYFRVVFKNATQYTHVLVNQGKAGPEYLPFVSKCISYMPGTLCPAPKPNELKPDPCITAIITNDFLSVVHKECVLKAGEPTKELISIYAHHKFYITNPSHILYIECPDPASNKGIIPSIRKTLELGIPCSCQLKHGSTLIDIERPHCVNSKNENPDVEYYLLVPTNFVKVRPEIAKTVRWSEINKYHNLYDTTKKDYVLYKDTIEEVPVPVPVVVKVPEPVVVEVPGNKTPEATREPRPHMAETNPYLWHFSVVYVFAVSCYRLYLADAGDGRVGAAFNLTPYFWRD